MKIENIVFDLGGVIMNLDVPKTIQAFKNMGIDNIVNDTGHHYTNPIFYDFEIGKVSEIEFIEELKGMSNLKLSTVEIKEAWNMMILDIPRERINILLDLKKKYRIYLLSNTNSIHQKKFLEEVNGANDFSFNNLFEKAYYSHEIKLRKPDGKAFEFVLGDSNLSPKETLFVDDSLQNINSAQKSGIQTFHIENYNLLSFIKDSGI